MLSLTRKADYALVALVYLGHRRYQGDGPVSARSIAETFDLPQPVLMNTLKALARADLVDSHRGVTGGYELSRDPAKVSLLEVVRAVEHSGEEAGAEADADPGEPAPPQATQTPEQRQQNDTRPAAPPWSPVASAEIASIGSTAVRRLQEKLDTFLGRLTLAHLLDHPAPMSAEAGRSGADAATGAKGGGHAGHGGEFVPLRTQALQ